MITKIHMTGIQDFFISAICLIFFFSCKVTAKNNPQANPASSQFLSRNDTSLPENVVHIKDFGAIGDGITNSTEAFQKAAQYLTVNGGTLVIDPGIYIVGKQKLSGRFGSGSSWIAEPVLNIQDATKPIEISGYNAILKAADGLKYGSFNPVTGKKDSLRKTGNISDYYASAFTFISGVRCSSISIKGVTLDGNSEKLNIGPGFGPDGIQLSALGIGLYSNKNASVDDCYIHHCALDGIIVSWRGLKDSDPVYKHTINNVKSEYNGRQGLSWVGGNNLTVINSEFSSTGKALNNGLPVVSKPSAGIDIEIENSVIKNGSFINCRVYNNTGPGIISIGHDTHNINFKNCTFIGTTNSAAYPKSQNFSFDSCTFVGRVERIFGSADKSKATIFKNCLFSLDNKRSPSGKVFSNTWEFFGARNVVFENCEFDAANKRLPAFNNKEIVFVNCKFSQDNDANFNASATFKGTTKFIMRGKGKLDISQSDFNGNIIYNDQKVTDIKKVKF